MKERTEYGEIWCLKIKYNNGSEIPPTAVGGWLKPSLQKRPSSWANPTDGSRWIVKAQPSSGAGWTLTIHRLPSVGFARSAAVDVGRVLTIHRLPSVGLWLAWLHLFFKDHNSSLRVVFLTEAFPKVHQRVSSPRTPAFGDLQYEL